MLLITAPGLWAQTLIKAEKLPQTGQFSDVGKELLRYDLFQLQIENASGLSQPTNDPVHLQLHLPQEVPLELVLLPARLKSEDYQTVVHTPQGPRALEQSIENFKGYLKSQPGSEVRLTVAQGQYSGVIYNYQGDNLHFKTLTRGSDQVMVVYRDSDLINSGQHKCGSPGTAKSSNSTERSSALADGCVLTEIYLIADAQAVEAFGGTPASAEVNMLEIMNLVNSHYEPVGVEYQVVGVFISTDPGGPWQVRSTADDQLDAAIVWFNNQNFPGDVFTFWSSPDWDFSYAYVGEICSYYGGNLCAAWGGLTANTLNSNTQSHELGHNWNAGHDASGIMRSTVSNQPASFSANSISVMTSYIPSVENVCLDSCVEDCSNFTADAGQDVNLCQGTSVQLQASGGSGYSWSPSSGLSDPDISNPVASPGSTTSYTVTVTSTGGCSATDQVTVTVDPLPLAEAGPDQILSCTTSTVQLDGTGSATGNEYSYQWNTSDGNISIGGNTMSPTVDAAGTYTLTVMNSNSGCQSSSQTLVTNDASLPTSDAGADAELTCAVTTVLLDGSNSSSGTNYAYQWTTNDGNIISGGNTLSPEIDAAGTYTLTVIENGSGCTTSDQAIVVVNDQLPTADAGLDGVIGCGDITADIGGNSSSGNEFSYQWNTSDGNIVSGQQAPVATVDAGGTYELLVTNSVTGCISSDQVTVTIDNQLPISDAGGDQILDCQVSDLTLDGSASSSGNDIIYQWTTSTGNILSGENLPQATVDQPGDYRLTVTNNLTGCQASDVVTVTLNGVLPQADAGTDGELNCAISSLSLDGSGSDSGANISYQWSTTNGNITSGVTSLNPTVDQAGTYTLTVTNTQTGCSSTDQVVVNNNASLPRADAGRGQAIGCNNSTVELRGDNSSSGNQFSYSWSTANGNIVSGQNTTTLVVDAPGTYTITVTNDNTGCSSSDQVSVTEDITLPAVEAGADQMIGCNTPEVQLDGSGSAQGNQFHYRWTTTEGNIVGNTSTQVITVDQSGVYRLTVTNTNTGCVQSDQVIVTGNTTLPNAQAGPNKTLDCENPTAQLGIGQTTQSDNFRYRWSTSDGNIVSEADQSSIIVDQAGTYSLEVENTLTGCSAQDQVSVTGDGQPPFVDVGSDEIVILGESIQLDAASDPGVQYQWSPANLMDDPNIPNPVVTPIQTVTITLTVTDAQGCSSQDQLILTVPLAEDLVIPNSFSPNGDGVNDRWRIPGIENLGGYQLEIYNRNGMRVHSGNSAWDGSYGGEILPTGTYFYLFKFQDQPSRTGHINIIK